MHYAGVPEGYSAYIDGQRAFTVDDLAHVSWNSKNGRGERARRQLDPGRIPGRARRCGSGGHQPPRQRAHPVDMFQKAGVDLSAETGWAFNLAQGKPVTASFTTTSPALRATAPSIAVDGYTISGLPADGPAGQAQRRLRLDRTPIWGTQGSTERPRTGSRSTWAWRRTRSTRQGLLLQRQALQPAAEIVAGYVPRSRRRTRSSTTTAPTGSTSRARTQPGDAAPQLQRRSRSRRSRPSASGVLVTPVTGFGVGVKEIQVFNSALYLHDHPTPPTGDTTSRRDLPLDNGAPTAGELHNYDTDRDAFPGILVQKGGSGAGETDPTKAQGWRFAAPQAGIRLAGDVELTFFAGMKDFDTSSSSLTKRGFVRAFLRDCPATGSGGCTTIASGSVDRRRWHGGVDDWIEQTITFASVDHTVAQGRVLEVKLTVDGRADDDMWFAYDTTAQPARLTVP